MRLPILGMTIPALGIRPVALYATIAAFSITGCSTLPDLPKTVSVPVAVSCIPKDAPSLPSVKSNAELNALAD